LADDQTPIRWIGPWKVGQAWPTVRRAHLVDVATANSVPMSVRTGAGTYGPTLSRSYDAEAVSRLAERLERGDAVVDPLWLRDTREGRRAQWITARDNVGCLLLIVLVAVALCGGAWFLR
jgi:hypothetical protein